LSSHRSLEQDIHSQLESSESALQSRLDDRSSLRTERAILDTLLHLSESLTRTEGLLGIESSEASHSNGASQTPAKAVESPITNGKPRLAVIIDAGEDDNEPKDIKTISRIASEYTQVMYLVEKARAEGCEYVTADEGAVEQVSWLQSTHAPTGTDHLRYLSELRQYGKRSF
jgi:hypothetical protein